MEDRHHRCRAANLPRLTAPLAALALALSGTAACGGAGGEKDPRGEPTADRPTTPAGDGSKSGGPAADGSQPGSVDPGARPWRASPALRRELAEVAAGAGAPAGAAIAALAGGPVTVAGELASIRAWSTIKVPLLVAFLDSARRARGEAGGIRLTPSERDDARAMITVSANDPANRLFLALAGRSGGVQGGARAIERTLRRGGDPTTRVTARPPDGRRTFTWLGQTRWRLADGVRWHRALARGKVAGAADTRFVLRLMRRIEGSAWGVRTALPASVPLAYKVGLGTDPEGLFEAEQYAIAGRGPGACVVAVAARGADAARAKATADRLARVALGPLRSGAGCR